MKFKQVHHPARHIEVRNNEDDAIAEIAADGTIKFEPGVSFTIKELRGLCVIAENFFDFFKAFQA